jgi:arabinofuranosyltransferase
MLSPLVRRVARFAPLLAGAVILIWHSLQYNFVTDDAYISFVFSRNFAEHGQLTFNLGDRVEGYTNFLWTFILGVLMLLGINPEISSRLLGTACALATLWVAFRLTDRLLGKSTAWSGVPAVLLGASAGFACWTSGGLETQMFTMLVAIAIDAYVEATAQPSHARLLRPWIRMGVVLALAAMTRPEGLLIAALIGVHRITTLLIAAWSPTCWPQLQLRFTSTRFRKNLRFVIGKPELVAVASMLILWAPWFAWRWWYYGWPFPNTYYVKANGPWITPKAAEIMWSNGGYYLGVWAKQLQLMWAAPLVLFGILGSIGVEGARRTFASLSLFITFVYLLYTASVGGDFMGLHRFIMPVFFLVAILVTVGIHDAISFALPINRRGSTARMVAVVLVTSLCTAFALSQFALTERSLRWGNFGNDRGIDTPRFLITYTEDRAAIGKAMAPCFAPDDFSIVGGAGAQPYFGHMRAIDVFGLVSERVAHEEPRSNPRAGHTKWASDTLLMQYDPTFIFSCYDIGTTPTHPTMGCAYGWISRGYEQLTMHIAGMRERGEYYTFLAKKNRQFQCPGLIR